jgi:hypothetical protein
MQFATHHHHIVVDEFFVWVCVAAYTSNNRRVCTKTRTEHKKKWSRYYLAEEGTGEKRGGGFGRFNRTTQQSDPVMRSAALVGKMPQRNRKTEFTYRLFAIRGGPEQCRGIDRRRGNFPYSIVCTQQSSLKKKNTRLVNRGRNDTVVCLVVFFFSPVSAVLQGRGGGFV